ncbi:MAG: translocation/assembly module TamB domain-containing protein [Candidatus Eremiobacteraeota bacterium]|nr:translocation/assembly module TamB domain-containing protein [Candidatus Eremiobacteraeota bacterium]
MRKRAALVVLAVVLVLLGVLVVQRQQVAAALLPRVISLAIGYDVSIGDQHIGKTHATFLHVHVSRKGEPVLDAAQVEVSYALRDLLPGSSHRFGVNGIYIDHPTLTLVRHKDGSYNIAFPGAQNPEIAAPQPPNRVPIAMNVRIRDGAGVVRAPYTVDPDSRTLEVTGLNLDANIDSAARTHYVFRGAFVEEALEPFQLVGTVDVNRGYAIHHAFAKAIPMRAIGNYFINSDAARLLAGTATDMEFKAYALDVEPDQPIDYHLSGAIDVNDVQMQVVGLTTPLRHIAGRLQMTDGTFFFNRLGAEIAGTPVAVSGGIYNFAAPQYRLGIDANGNLQTLRQMFAFTKTQPIDGAAHMSIEVQGDLGNPVVLASMDAPRAVYNTLPIRNMHVKIAYQNNSVMLAPLQATVHGAHVSIRGMIGVGKVTHTQAALHFEGPASTLPYFGALLGTEPIVGDVMLDGQDTNFLGNGAMQSVRGLNRMAAVLHVDRPGIIDVGPFWIDTERGRFAAEYHLDRQTNTSAFWMDAHRLRLHSPLMAGAFGKLLPDIPSFDGTVDAFSIEGGGPSGLHALVAGAMDGHALHISGVGLDKVHAQFSGTLADAAIEPLNARGSWGTIDGDGALSLSALAVKGMYHGTLEGLRPFLQDPSATGTVDGPAAIAIAGGRITVQADGLTLRNAKVHGLPLEAMRGTLAVDNGALTVLSAHAQIAGGDVVAAGRFDRGITLVASRTRGSDLRGLGLPLEAGYVSATGSLKQGPKIPSFTGGVAIAQGRMQQFDIDGTALIALHDDTVHLDHVVGALDGMYTIASGDLTQLTSGSPAYAVHANVPAADVGDVIHMLTLRSPFPIDGTYSASVDVHGRGLNPTVAGPVEVGAGSVNGLSFTDGRALIDASTRGARARQASVQVASTHLAFAAALNAPIPGAAQNTPITGVRVRAPGAHLEDFNNFFDTGDTLAGNGPVRFDVVSQRHQIKSNGNIDVAGLRYRNLAIGDTRAVWSTSRNLMKGSLVVGGAQGLLRAKGSIGFTPSPSWFDVLRDSRYNLSIDLDDLNTSTWLGAFGFGQVPLSGRLDADATIEGRYPRLHVNGTSSLNGGTMGPLPIESADIAFSSLADRIRIDSASLVTPGLTATASGSFGLAATDPIDLDLYLNSDDMPRLIEQVWRKNVQLQGVYESTISARGTPSNPQFAAAFDASNAVVYGVKIPSIFGSLRWNLNTKTIELSNAGAQFEHGDISLAGSLPLRLNPFGAGPPHAPINLDLAVTSLDPSTFQTLLGNNTQLGGTIDGELAVAGTVGTPRIYGRFSLAKGSYVSDLDRTPITSATATLTFDRTQATVQHLSANLGAGTVAASGHVAFPAGTSGATYHVDVTAKNAQGDNPQFGSGAFDGRIALNRAPNQLAHVSGDIALHDATIPFAAFLAATQNSGAGGGPAFPFDLGFDMKLAVGKNVRVRGSGFGAGLDIGASGAVNLAGTLSSPTLEGQFVGTGGTLTYFDRAFRLTDAVVTFTPSQGIIPTLHAQGVTHVTNPDPRVLAYSTDVTINVDGPINGLKIAFSTNPPGYTNDQILAMIAPFSGLIGGTNYLPSGANNPTINGVTPQGALNVVPGAQPIGQPSSSISVGQEAFNILNAQFSAGILAPVENVVSQGLGFQNFNLNVDYYGNVGFSATRLLGKTVNFIYSQTFGTPSIYSAGLQLIGPSDTSAQLSFYWSTGPQVLFKTPAGVSTSSHLSVGQPLQGQSGFAFNLQRLYW